MNEKANKIRRIMLKAPLHANESLHRAQAIFLMGPTASGKTALAVELVQHLPCEIISVDSAMVYRGMDVGTAKPAANILRVAPHRLIDIRDPSDPYSAAQFRRDALAAMAEIAGRGRVPLLVGGTMLYFQALERGLADLPPASPALRRCIEAEARSVGWSALHAQLAAIDPESAARIHPHDPQRIQRALEIYELTGESLSQHLRRETLRPFPYRILKLVLAPRERKELYRRIEARFADMVREGLVEEVEKLFHSAHIDLDLPALRAVGYRQVWEYLVGRCSYDEMSARAVTATRQLAKRQLTWIRNTGDVHWLYSDCCAALEDVVKQLYSRSGQSPA
jgi:tRNA dimethylallyltransferase